MPQVSFPDCVRWTTIEFDQQCGTAQPEDVIRLLIPSRTLHLSSLGGKPLIHDTINTWTELKKFSGSTGWPTTVLVLPGRRAWERNSYWYIWIIQLRKPLLRPEVSLWDDVVLTLILETEGRNNSKEVLNVYSYNLVIVLFCSHMWFHLRSGAEPPATTGRQPLVKSDYVYYSDHLSLFYYSIFPFSLLSGNEVLFSLETASDYVKDEKASFYGFKCVAVGYEFNPGPDEVLTCLFLFSV